MAEVSGLEKIRTEIEFNPFEGPEIDHIVACTEPQVEILTSCLLGGDDANLAFNQSVTLKFKGFLDRAAMDNAFQKLILRHESLRSAFSINHKQLFIFKNLSVQLYYEDVSAREFVKKQQIVNDFIQRDSLYLFDLVNGPLFKASLIKLSDEQHSLIVTVHHIICDGWSLGIILQDLGQLYSACVQNKLTDIPKPILFRHFAREQINFSQSKEYKEIEKFWLDQYSDGVPVLDLPTDFTRPQVRTYKSNCLYYNLESDVVASIKKMGTKAGCSLVTFLFAAFEVFLYRLTGQDDIVVGLPAAGQSVTANYYLVGHCVNLLPLRSNQTPVVTFLNYLERRKSAIFDSYEHQQFTFGSLLKKLRIPRDSSRIPLVPVVFNIDLGMDEGVNFYGLTYHLENNPRAYENFELFLNISGSENTLTLEWSYNTQLFKADTIGRMMEGFENLLKAIIINPNVMLGDIELSNKNAIINKLDQATTNYPDQPLHELITQIAKKYPAKTALIFQEQEISYKVLDERSNSLAHYFIKKGILAGDFVGVALDRSPEMLITLLAVMKAGAAYIPLDPEYPEHRISFILKDAAAKMLITSKKNDKKFNHQDGFVFIESAITESTSYKVTPPEVRVSAHDLVYLLYTSGSTGKPKGVLIEHHSVVNLLNSMQEFPGFSAEDILLAVTTIAFDISVLELFLPLVTGGTVVLSTAAEARDGESLMHLVEKKKVSVMQATPSTWKMMLSSGWRNKEGIKILIGGEAIKEEIKDSLTKIGDVYNLYGPTETTIWSVSKKLEINEKVLIGKPIANTGIYIIGEQMELAPAGVAGEICIGGAGLARGYLNRPELTSQKFISNPFSKETGSRIYRTGDIGRLLPDGNLECLGRLDDQVKIRGYRIELGEIENTLEAITGIKEAIVVCRQNKLNEAHLVAFVVRNDEGSFARSTSGVLPSFLKMNGKRKEVNSISILSKEQVNEWKKWVSLRLPDYMVPSHFEILHSMPLTPNGKIDRTAMPEPPYITGVEEQTHDKLFSKNEKIIADIWTDLLNIKNIGINDNFFELGGHSLIAIEVMTRIEKYTGKKLSASTLFQNSTISALASVLDNPPGMPEWKSLVSIKPSGNKVPLYIIHGLGLDVMFFHNIARYMSADQPVYGLKQKLKEGEEESLGKIEDMASFYISEITRQNPTGPYALIGYSAGSVIAFEMAKQLKAMNKEIKMIGIIDYHIEKQGVKSFLSKRVKRYTTEFFPRQFHFIRSLILYPKYSIKFQHNYFKSYYLKLMAAFRAGSRADGEKIYVEKTDNEMVLDKFRFALKNYLVAPVDVGIDLFISKVEVTYIKDKKFLGWKPFALKGIKLHKIPGDHFDMILPPNCKEFASILQNQLDNS